MIRQILIYPRDKSILTQKSEKIEEIDDSIHTLIEDLKETLHKEKLGVGISAVQVGELKRLCIVKYNNQDIVLINPEITRKRGEVISREGCLSAPDTYTYVPRAQKIWCTYTDENGNEKELSDGGKLSIIVQHEVDHLDGWCKVFDAVEEK